MKPYDTFENKSVEIVAFDEVKQDMLIWRCTEEQGRNLNEVVRRVKRQGYSSFEKITRTDVMELFQIEEESKH